LPSRNEVRNEDIGMSLIVRDATDHQGASAALIIPSPECAAAATSSIL
jgi:hypothetical protein